MISFKIDNKVLWFALIGIGRWSDNKLLSFIEDTSLPFPFFQKVQDNDKDLTSSWKRRVDVNVIAYFTVLAIFSLMNTIYATLVSLILFHKEESNKSFLGL